MPLDRKLLEILCCPATKVPVQELDAGRLQKINEVIASGSVTLKSMQKTGSQITVAAVDLVENVWKLIREHRA